MATRRAALFAIVALALPAGAEPLAISQTDRDLRALLVQTMASRDHDERGRLIAAAEAKARAVLSQSPGDAAAKLFLAVSIGMKARRATPLQAYRAGWAQEGKALIVSVTRAAPDNAWAQALLGGWHLEVLRRGGPAGAALLGAKENLGLAAFRRARALAPQDGAIALQFAIALLGYQPARFADEAAQLLTAALASPQAAEDFAPPLRALAAQISETLGASGPTAAKDLVDQLA
jgi:hypothetical protein